MNKISFSNSDIKFTLKNKKNISAWIIETIEKEKKICGQIAYVFCSDDFLLDLNQRFLNHNTYTDIITFDYSEGKTLNGEMYISIDRVKENAQKFEVDFEKELLRVIIHGALHLAGYKDKTNEQKEKMRKKEDAALMSYLKMF
ncbi:MAG: endoribonuclease YbeY [Bacteroidia bacterium]|nr:MAG: endoribonuclease YbeY [Bacteroidia bacterium]